MRSLGGRDPSEVRLCHRQWNLCGCGALQNFANGIDLSNVLQRELEDRGAAVTLALDQAESLELHKSLSQHVALCLQAVGQLLFDQACARREAPEHDVVLQDGQDLLRAFTQVKSDEIGLAQ